MPAIPRLLENRGTGNKKMSSTLLALLLAVLVCIVAFLRGWFVSPVMFFEGDDAAVAAGVARQCAEEDIGPYFFHPPNFSKYEYRTYILSQKGEGDPDVLEKFKHPQRPPFYRYHTMTGVYFLGRLNCEGGEAGPRLLRYSFLAGTLFPLLLALIIFGLFRPLPSTALPLIYLLIALSPESWISGSAYFNDKILAVFFLSICLVILVYQRNPRGIHHWISLTLAGVCLGMAILIRFDSILFLPAPILIIFLPNSSLTKRIILLRILRISLLLVSAGAVYFLIMRIMQASIGIALAPVSVIRFFLNRLAEKASIILAAFGWGQLIVLGGLTIAGVACLIDQKSSREKAYVADKYVRRDVFPDRQAAIIPLDALLITGLLVFAELVFFFTNWFSSPKYLLLGSSVAAGLCIAIPFKFLYHLENRGKLTSFQRRLTLIAVALCMLLPFVAALVKLGQVQTEDGPRYLGGWMRQRISPHLDSIAARDLFACLESGPPGLDGDVVVKTSSWLFEETMAYEAAIRSLQNRVVPTSAAIMNNEGNPVSFLSLNEYLIPGNPPISVYVTSDVSVYRHGDLMTEAVFAEAIGLDFAYYQDLDCVSP